MNSFPNEGNSIPQSEQILHQFLLIFLSLLSLTLLPQALASIFLHLLSSAVPVQRLHTVYISLLSLFPALTAIHQLFAISFPFLYSASALLKASAIQALRATVVQPKYFMVAV